MTKTEKYVMDTTKISMPTRTGGTLKLTVPKDGNLYICHGCEGYFQRHMYIHQCSPDHRPLCYNCMTRRSACKRCGHMRTTVYQNDIEMWSV